MNFLSRGYSILIIFCLLPLAGCTSDSVVYHERTQFGLNLEARPELNTPVDLNLAYKRNLMAIVPSKNEDDEKEGLKESPLASIVCNKNDASKTKCEEGEDCYCYDPNEAVSVLSTFGMEYKKGSFLFKGTTLDIQNHFATGNAAKILIQEKDTEAIKVFSGGGGAGGN